MASGREKGEKKVSLGFLKRKEKETKEGRGLATVSIKREKRAKAGSFRFKTQSKVGNCWLGEKV